MAATFRSATPADLEAVVALLADDALGATREQPENAAAYAAAFEAIDADPAHDILLAVDGDTILGCLQLTVMPCLTHGGRARAQVEGVRVAAAARGQGIGAALLEEAARRATKAGCHVLQLTTDKRRPDAIRFYERLGFQPTHEGMKRPL